MNEKIDNTLNIALNLPEEDLEKSQELSVGIENDIWELIIRYQGDLDELRRLPNVNVRELSNGYAVITTPKNLIDAISNLEQIIFIEKPKRLEYSVLNGKRESCINQVQQDIFFNNGMGLFGEGVIVGIADSGIDYTNSVFRNQDGSTRILRLWDQVTDTVYSESDINQALMLENSYTKVNSRDLTGHGTHVAGIAAGNFADNKNNNLGIATKSKLVIVKMATATDNSFPRTTRLMEAIDFIVKTANEYKMPLSLNISFGNTYGSHDGTTLVSSYINSVIDGNRISVQIGTGNEGDGIGHTSGYAFSNEDVELQVSAYQKSISIQLWKDYVDTFAIQIEAPTGERTSVIRENNRESNRLNNGISDETSNETSNEIGRSISDNVENRRGNSISSYTLGNTNVFILYGSPKPYTRYQEIYMDLIPVNQYIDSGIWIIRIIPEVSVVGRYDMWLPGNQSINTFTGFLKPDPEITLTIPSATDKAISVGAYDTSTDKVATFSGRGFTRENNQIKPDIVAPGVNIRSAATGGGTTVLSGTSMATPFVTGSAALMMEWGIVRGNDPYLYGEKIKAYLIRGAKHLPGYEQWPNKQAGWGALCLRDSLV